MFKKIFLILFFSSIILGIVYAADQSSFKVPSDFEDLGDGVYVLYDSSKNADEILSVVKFNEHDWKDYTTNDTENKYTVIKEDNNTYNYTDKSIDEVGSFELVEAEGAKFIIDFAKSGSDSDLSYTYDNLMEFNKLNDLKPAEK